MAEIRVEVGKQIRFFRKNRKMTQEELASSIQKSKATLSKYEHGEISIDIDTLAAIAETLQIRVEQLLFTKAEVVASPDREINPAFFQGVNHFYVYYFDGRNGQMSSSILDVYAPIGENKYKVAMYMNYKDQEQYQLAENVYWGYVEHFDDISIIELTHQNTPREKASIQILASFQDADSKWGLWNGVSSRPIMPVAVKMLFSKKALEENADLAQSLKLTKEDLRRIKFYNMFSVI